MFRINWRGVANLVLSALGWGTTAFVASFADAGLGLPLKAALGVAATAAVTSIGQHVRQSPNLLKGLIDQGPVK